MRRTPFYNFFIVALLVTMTASVSAQQVDSKLPWSVRLTESEMIRYPESWQLDFQPKLKWDYCHGLELGAMLDVYDAYGDKKIPRLRYRVYGYNGARRRKHYRL